MCDAVHQYLQYCKICQCDGLVVCPGSGIGGTRTQVVLLRGGKQGCEEAILRLLHILHAVGVRHSTPIFAILQTVPTRGSGAMLHRWGEPKLGWCC